MSYLLDIIGASSIAGYVMLMVISLNARILEASTEILMATITRRQSAVTT